MRDEIQFVLRGLWRAGIAQIAVPLLYGIGVCAMYSDDYPVAAGFYFVSIAWCVAKTLDWEETKKQKKRGVIGTIVLVLGALVFIASLVWIQHRQNFALARIATPPQVLTQDLSGTQSVSAIATLTVLPAQKVPTLSPARGKTANYVAILVIVFGVIWTSLALLWLRKYRQAIQTRNLDQTSSRLRLAMDLLF